MHKKGAFTASVKRKDPVSNSITVHSLKTAITKANLMTPFKPLGPCIHPDISYGGNDS